MIDYNIYLQKEGYATTTIKSNEREVKHFQNWCKRNSVTAIEIDYKTSLKYIKHLTRKGNSKKTINHKLGSLKIYFNYLISEAFRHDNPLENINIKGVKRTINYNLLEPDELEDLYYSYETENIKDTYHQLTAKRNKIIVGLMMYQGLNTTDLIHLEVENLELYKGRVYIKSGRKSNARMLELKSWQVIELLEYIKEVREEIKRIKHLESERLFIPSNARLGNTILDIIKKLKTYNHKVVNINQIRASVITNWLKQYNLRETQYFAGHRYISSTERYVQDDLENLHEIVNNYHPIS